MSSIYLALVHYPVKNRAGDPITTAITNLDIHDLARLSRTYGLAGYCIVTPITAQRELVERVLGHWDTGPGKERLPTRSEALSLVTVAASIQDVVSAIAAQQGQRPRLIATAATSSVDTVSYGEARRQLENTSVPSLILLGTGHGLANSVLEEADQVLAPIQGISDRYNHLSVRTAAAIIIDRLLGDVLPP
ncbi:MAG: RNA methyltransferase [Myxococcota bacterium]